MNSETFSENQLAGLNFSFNVELLKAIPSLDSTSFWDELPVLKSMKSQATQKAAPNQKNAASHKKNPPRKKLKGKRKRAKKRVRRVIPKNKVYIRDLPTDFDVLLGRGGRANNHPGNKRYFKKVLSKRKDYRDCGNAAEKNGVARSVVDFVQKRGRFLLREDETKRWFVVPDKVALDKAKQALRDKHIPVWAAEIDPKQDEMAPEHDIDDSVCVAPSLFFPEPDGSSANVFLDTSPFSTNGDGFCPEDMVLSSDIFE